MEKLAGMTLYQLRLFIVFGGVGGEECTYTDKQSPALFRQAVETLSRLGLIETTRIGNAISFKNTEDGIRIHESFMNEIQTLCKDTLNSMV